MSGPWVPDSAGLTVQVAPDSGVPPVPAYAGPLVTTSAVAREVKPKTVKNAAVTTNGNSAAYGRRSDSPLRCPHARVIDPPLFPLNEASAYQEPWLPWLPWLP